MTIENKNILDRTEELSSWRSREFVGKRTCTPGDRRTKEMSCERSWVESTVWVVGIRTVSVSEL